MFFGGGGTLESHNCSAPRSSSGDSAVDLAIELEKLTADGRTLSKSNWFHTGFSCYKPVKVLFILRELGSVSMLIRHEV